MSDAAHGESLEHEVFQTPFKVRPQFEVRRTPDSYRRRPGGEELTNRMEVWPIASAARRIGGQREIQRTVNGTIFELEDQFASASLLYYLESVEDLVVSQVEQYETRIGETAH